jgi:hypothetical protein
LLNSEKGSSSIGGKGGGESGFIFIGALVVGRRALVILDLADSDTIVNKQKTKIGR